MRMRSVLARGRQSLRTKGVPVIGALCERWILNPLTFKINSPWGDTILGEVTRAR
jgi:hypothetical protein